MPPTDTPTYWLMPGETPIGPYRSEEILAQIQAGSCSWTTKACLVGSQSWTPLNQLLTLAPVAALATGSESPVSPPSNPPAALPSSGGSLFSSKGAKFIIFALAAVVIFFVWGNRTAPIGTENWNVWADLNGSNSLQVRYARGDATDELFSRVKSDGTVASYLTDRMGSVRQLVDASGAVQDTIVYDGFGNVLSESNSSFGDRWKWTGREYNNSTGLQYNRARYYNSETGQWMSEDSIRLFSLDYNFHRYSFNGTANLLDPSGNIPPLIWACLGITGWLIQTAASEPPPPGSGTITIGGVLPGIGIFGPALGFIVDVKGNLYPFIGVSAGPIKGGSGPIATGNPGTVSPGIYGVVTIGPGRIKLGGSLGNGGADIGISPPGGSVIIILPPVGGPDVKNPYPGGKEGPTPTNGMYWPPTFPTRGGSEKPNPMSGQYWPSTWPK